ncbi:MAG: sulfurtransferase [Cyclobacteriaceae bacterium]|nr:sulfurtransferase [Cyclobacteriaceae bacterium]
MGKNIISATELSTKLGNSNLVIVDTRFKLGNPEYGIMEYGKGHIPGAIYLDLEKDLSAPLQQHGGRHPLPGLDALLHIVENTGIQNSSHVVIYDDAAGMYAGRFWWLLKYAGHSDAQVLDGGWQEWNKLELPLDQRIPLVEKTKYIPDIKHDMLVSMQYVREKMSHNGTVLIDARAPDRYLGLHEPIDPKAGHIPGAINKPFSENLQDGKFKTASALYQQYKDLESTSEIIMYCGSGVSAVHNIIALDEAGIGQVKLYAGSWSDWISYEENPVATLE